MANENSVVLKDVELAWCYFNTTNNLSGKYQVDLVNLTPEHLSLLESLGLKARTRNDRPEKGNFIVCKSMRPMVPLDQSGDLISDPGSVGNGSRANVRLTYYVPKKKPVGAPDRSPSLQKIVITDLVVYGGADDSGDDDDLL